MFWLLVALLLILLVAAAVVVYVAYPHRGEEVPHAPWLGEALKRGVEALPTLDGELAPRIPSQDARREGHPENQPKDQAARS
jgi:hypothetical protein